MKTTMVRKGTPEFEELENYIASHPRMRWQPEIESREFYEFRLKQNLFTLACFDKDTPHDKRMRQDVIKQIDKIEMKLARKGFI